MGTYLLFCGTWNVVVVVAKNPNTIKSIFIAKKNPSHSASAHLYLLYFIFLFYEITENSGKIKRLLYARQFFSDAYIL